MKDYDVFQRNYHKQQKKIQEVNSKTEVINEESKDIKELLNVFKQQPLNKNNLLLSNENKDLKEELNNKGELFIRCSRKKDKQIRTRYIFFRRQIKTMEIKI